MHDPTILLSHEHEALRGQLELLEDPSEKELLAVLQTLQRDSTVHFKRENVLFEMLSSEFGQGGQQLKSLMIEHEGFKQETKDFIEMLTPVNGFSSYSLGAGLKKKLQCFADQFRAHIRHEETVVFLLAKSRLTPTQLRSISQKILAL